MNFIKSEYKDGFFNVSKKNGFLPEKNSVYAIALLNDQKTSKKSLYLGGNQYLVKPQFGRHDASKGWRLDFDNDAGEMLFKIPKPLGVKGQIRAIEQIDFSETKRRQIMNQLNFMNHTKLFIYSVTIILFISCQRIIVTPVYIIRSR